MSDVAVPTAWIGQQLLSRLPSNPSAEQFETVFEGLKAKINTTLGRTPAVGHLMYSLCELCIVMEDGIDKKGTIAKKNVTEKGVIATLLLSWVIVSKLQMRRLRHMPALN